MAFCSICPSGCDVSVTATVTVSDPAAVSNTPSSLRATGEGTTPAGVKSLSFFNDGAAEAVVNGQTLAAGASMSFPSLGIGQTYGAIAYDASGTSLRIDYVS